VLANVYFNLQGKELHLSGLVFLGLNVDTLAFVLFLFSRPGSQGRQISASRQHFGHLSKETVVKMMMIMEISWAELTPY
jgi:hypothetical protein